jgi:hypothetical protein
MKVINFGRRRYTFANGSVELMRTDITERSLNGEDEDAFTRRLMRKYGNSEGTIEIVFKKGRPDYAIVTFT